MPATIVENILYIPVAGAVKRPVTVLYPTKLNEVLGPPTPLKTTVVDTAGKTAALIPYVLINPVAETPCGPCGPCDPWLP